ncbi:unnamed protein product, partial [Brenthis ino]
MPIRRHLNMPGSESKGPQRDDGSWRVRRNAQIEEIISKPQIIGKSKAARLSCLDYVERMTENDLRQLEESDFDWRKAAQDKKEWRNLVFVHKIHFGSLSKHGK